MSYAGRWTTPEWRDNYVFEATITYKSFSRGRSAANFEFENTLTGQTYNVFMKDMDSFVPIMVHGNVTSKFCFVKRGDSYGIALYEGE